MPWDLLKAWKAGAFRAGKNLDSLSLLKNNCIYCQMFFLSPGLPWLARSPRFRPCLDLQNSKRWQQWYSTTQMWPPLWQPCLPKIGCGCPDLCVYFFYVFSLTRCFQSPYLVHYFFYTSLFLFLSGIIWNSSPWNVFYCPGILSFKEKTCESNNEKKNVDIGFCYFELKTNYFKKQSYSSLFLST